MWGGGGGEEESQGNIYLKGHNLHSCIIFPERLLTTLLSYWVDTDFRSTGFILLNINNWYLNIHLRGKEQYHFGGKNLQVLIVYLDGSIRDIFMAS